MPKAIIELGRVRPGRAFQADRYSFSERRRRRLASPLTRLAEWWRSASFMERACRILWLSCCGAFGMTLGFSALVLLWGLFT